MKRPIPEGVGRPNVQSVILGWGGDFRTDGVFEGYLIDPDEDEGWEAYELLSGENPNIIYAADAGSEVARLNHDTNLPLSANLAEDPRDGAIRGLVLKWRKLSVDSGFPQNYKNALEYCADELEALL